MTRGSSVTSLYSQEKERKSVSIRRSRSKPSPVRGGRDQSNAATSEETTQSLERMYTFNLSRVQKSTTQPASFVGGAKDKDGKSINSSTARINNNNDDAVSESQE